MTKKAKILLIDDDHDILQVLKANLELHNFSVAICDTWKAGKEALLDVLPDLVLLDAMLPDGDGFEICRILRDQKPALPIIMLTARDKVSDKVIGLESGADDYLVKPFETLELIARIKACLRRAQPARARRISTGEIEIDFDRRQAIVNNRPIVLTLKEYELLGLLVSNMGRVVSREDIRRHLWKEEKLYSWSRVIDVHIQHLRQKIEKNASEPEYIHTVIGVGYRFEAGKAGD
jgi:DNA-binding response OmpR family regulator